MPVSPKATILGQSKNNYQYQMFFLKKKKWLFGCSVLCICTYLDFYNKEKKKSRNLLRIYINLFRFII